MAGGWPVVEVDTNNPVDLSAVIAAISAVAPWVGPD